MAYLRYHLSALLGMAAAGYGSAAQAARWREILEHLPHVPTATGSVTQNGCTPAQLAAERCPEPGCGWVRNGSDPVGCKPAACGPCVAQEIYGEHG